MVGAVNLSDHAEIVPARKTGRQVAGSLTDELRNYFNALEARERQSGYPTVNILSKDWIMGGAGHKILYMSDLPPRARLIGVAMKALPARYRHVLAVKYGVDRHEDGSLVTNRQRADALEITLEAFNSRLKTARRKLLKKMPDFWPI